MSLLACGGGGGSSSQGGGTPPSTDQVLSGTQIGTGGAGFQFSTKDMSAPIDGGPSSGPANSSAQIDRVYLAQTHFLETSSPFFFLNANRPALLKVNVIGASASPVVSVEGSKNGTNLGTLYLQGPATLPASVATSSQSKDNSFTVTLPALWIQPGLSLKIQAGSDSRTFLAADLKVGPAPAFTFVVADFLLFGNTTAKAVPADMLNQYLAGVPYSRIQFSKFPVPIQLDKVASPPRGDGRDGFGTAIAISAVVMDRMSSATAAEKAAGKATPWSGFAVLGANLSLLNRIQAANGMHHYSHWYALNSGTIGGGLGGGVTCSGDDFSGIFFHEMGHTFDMPHWGDAWGSRGSATSRYPYAGVQKLADLSPQGGGVGETWGYEQDTGNVIPPTTAASNRTLEKQDPMQGGGHAEVHNGVSRLYSMFSDFSSYWAYRYHSGAATAQAGQVNYAGLAVDYALPIKSGRPNWDPNSGALTKWDAGAAAYQSIDTTGDLNDYPKQAKVPVYTLFGSYSRTTPEANLIYTPLRYTGNLRRLWDPTNPADFSAMKASANTGYFWWGWDFVVAVEFSSGLKRTYLVPANLRGTNRDNPLHGDSFTYWAINIPDEGTLRSVTFYHRPTIVRYSGTQEEGNLNDAAQGITAANYLSKATQVMKAVIQ